MADLIKTLRKEIKLTLQDAIIVDRLAQSIRRNPNTRFPNANGEMILNDITREAKEFEKFDALIGSKMLGIGLLNLGAGYFGFFHKKRRDLKYWTILRNAAAVADVAIPKLLEIRYILQGILISLVNIQKSLGLRDSKLVGELRIWMDQINNLIMDLGKLRSENDANAYIH